jgi:uncharacterized membrane protein YkgB
LWGFAVLSQSNALIFARGSLALIFVWFGAMNFTSVGTGIISGWLEGHAFLSGLAAQASSAAKAIGIYQIVAGLLIGAPIPSGSFRRLGFAMAGIYCIIALTMMFTNPVWIESLGGFPAIGSGQGIIKYVGILGLVMWAGSFNNTRLFSQRRSAMRDLSQHMMWFGLVLVLLWIGAMKFTLPEAQGIEPLIATSPFLFWMQNVLGVQEVSWVIGLLELATVGALLGYWFNRRLLFIGLALSAATFVMTLTFLFSFAPSWDAELGGFPNLASTGHFLLKDLALLAGCYALAAELRESGYR